ncbi:tRNA dihydrouridine synthase DusB [Candidatus Hydrogenedentota bacterium]
MTYSLEIGSLTLNSPVFLAPMAGISDLPHRLTARRFFSGLVCTEMVSCQGIIRDQPKTLALLNSVPEEKPIAAQIFGANPGAMAESARFVTDKGFDAVDINMGCPVPKVVRSGSGSALMKDLPLAARIVEEVVRATHLPVTVKFRAGWSETDRNAVEMTRMCEEAGAAGACIHPRTRSQMFQGKADWAVIGEAVNAVKIPVIGSGDIFRVEDAVQMVTQTACAGIMVGRVSQGNPWLVGRIEDTLLERPMSELPSDEDRFALAKEHLELSRQYFTERGASQLMKKHLGSYFRGMKSSAEFRRRVNLGRNYGEVLKALDEFASETLGRVEDTVREGG